MTSKTQKANYQQNTEKKESAKQLIDCGLRHPPEANPRGHQAFPPSNSKCKKSPSSVQYLSNPLILLSESSKNTFFPYLPFALSVGMRIFVG